MISTTAPQEDSMVSITATGRYPFVAGIETISGTYELSRELALIAFGMDFGEKMFRLDPESLKIVVSEE